MTIDERVDECVKKILHSGDLTRDVIKATLIAAVEEEREACAMIALEMKGELSQRPEKLQYGRTQIEVAGYIAEQIRARSNS